VSEPLNPAALRQLLLRDMPDAVLEAPARQPAAEPAAARKGEAAPPNLLATDDVVVRSERLPEVARLIRDQLGYELLSNITATDFLRDGVIEVVYHFYRLDGGPALVLKVRVERERPELPSLTPWWPGADFQEREAFDLFGVVFNGHPRLRRIYMWDEFEGFPMRKDFPRQGDKYLEGGE
jgi:NADH-quinone oxidoreductase subunit C